MQVLPLSAQAIAQALNILNEGGIVAHATETCYGFACDLTNPEAVQKLFLLKKRPFDQPVSALFPSVAEAKKYVEWNDEAEKLAREFLPGPLTLILPKRPTSQELFIVPAQSSKLKAQSSVGIRISSHPLATELACRFGRPLSTTSANVHGRTNTYSVKEITAQWTHEKIKPDIIIDSGHLLFIPPSKIIDLSHGTHTVLRKGAL
ncbi:MAG: L-threonylcarbamoyladenylate synthase [Candidatus Peregrinibacteria bacterium]